jgi:hypothetical protein
MCSKKSKESFQPDWNSLIIESLENEFINDSEKQLCLFIADDMCSECIASEYRNIKKDSLPVSVIGLFRNKRIFGSISNQSFIKNRIFIDRKPLYNFIIPKQPVYFIYDKKTKVISDIFYPLPCETEKTFSYFFKIKNNYSIINQ